MNPYQVVKDFERGLCEYTCAPYAVTVNSCTMALLLAVAWHLRSHKWGYAAEMPTQANWTAGPPMIEIPKRTYVSVPMSIIHAGGRPTFRDEEWIGEYQLKPLPVWDCARIFTSAMYRAGRFQCVSFHWSKTLGIQQGGAILHDDPAADIWFRKARFDGRQEQVPPNMDHFDMVGWHAYMSPEVAAAGLMRLRLLKQHNDPLPNDPYPDLSEMEIFK